MIASVAGIETPNGDFEVRDVSFVGMPPQRPKEPSDASPTGQWVAIASGLELGGTNPHSMFQAELLQEWITGSCGASVRHLKRISQCLANPNSYRIAVLLAASAG